MWLAVQINDPTELREDPEFSRLMPGTAYTTRQKIPWTKITVLNPQKRGNPAAATIREEFTGAPAEYETITSEPHIPAGDYAQLGELLALYVKPMNGGPVQQISFVKRTEAPLLVSDESARQIYFVGGAQDVSSGLSVFGAVSQGGGQYLLGEVRRIDYKQRKEHVGSPEQDEWKHNFGEETGVKPMLVFDADHKRLLLQGGEYRIRREGIIN